jgi:exodeoxyribonuclease VIII
MNDVMVDLETLGTSSKAAIISIGAVFFDPAMQVFGPTFYRVASLESNLRIGREMDGSTVRWWMTQSDEARAIFNYESAVPLPQALDEFASYLRQFEPDPTKYTVKLWGNGSDFDNVLLASAYADAGTPVPWKFYNNRCFRTLKSHCPSIKMARVGTHHNALDDAKSQAQHALLVLKALGGYL